MYLFGKPKKDEIISASFQILTTFRKAYHSGDRPCVYYTDVYKQQYFLPFSLCFARENSFFT